MPLLRPRLASRLLQANPARLQYIAPRGARWASKTSNGKYADRSAQPAPKASSEDPPSAEPGDSGMIRQEDPAEGLVDHQPNYHAPIDHGTSQFSQVPKRVMDGSEPVDITLAAVLSGAPVDLQARTVRIYRPAKTATQSGDWHGHHWRMDWDILQKGHRWENPLMGWQSSADYLQGTHLNFKSKEDAIHFANKQGYEYFVQEPNERRIVPKAYANNFMHSPKRLKKIPTK
ncbi:hypothetical protein N7G274_007336 [Stereocaulon virgatum]|uniref:NADH dehydrogenase [ubiquinone] iron-sulfur protein 4, mitochondrial n=1 Tax=Stereocaulon virgatum TaxID=373712 RepID=A0ABR4A4D6_9LECA